VRQGLVVGGVPSALEGIEPPWTCTGWPRTQHGGVHATRPAPLPPRGHCPWLRTSSGRRGVSQTGSDPKRQPPDVQRKAMADQDATPQEKVTRWTAQRAAHEKQQDDYRAARRRTTGRHWLLGGAIVLIVAVIAAAVLL
jgi:hypothetical protein